MRVWDIHPGYLSRQSLLGQHVEIHAIYNVLDQEKKGYANHPETRRWADNLDILKTRHDQTVLEMLLRGYRHQSPIVRPDDVRKGKWGLSEYIDTPASQFEILRDKYRERGESGRIPLAKNSSSFWAHHKYAVMARGYQYYKEIQQLLKSRKDHPIVEDEELIEIIYKYLEKEPGEKSIRNVLDHLWGYLKKLATDNEKEIYRGLNSNYKEQLDLIYRLSLSYDILFLKQSTIFADIKLNDYLTG